MSAPWKDPRAAAGVGLRRARARFAAPAWVGAATLAGALVLVLAGARAAQGARGQTLSLSLGLATEYDDNLLQYSPNQRDLFLGGTRPDRFSIHTLDDVTWSPQIGMAWTLDQGRGRRRMLRARFSGDFHSNNPTADFHSTSVSWHEYFHGGRHLAIGYYHLPKYYLRQLIAEDYVPPFPGMSRYRRAEFGLGIGSLSWEQSIGKRADLGFAYQLENRSYNPDFSERDSQTHQAKASLSLAGSARGRGVDLLAGYRWELANGEDGDEPETPPDADVSYHGPIAGVAGHLAFARRDAWRSGGSLSYSFGSRGYDSDRPADLYHFGRTDRIHTVEAGLWLGLKRHWTARTNYAYEIGDTQLGTNAPPSSDVGSYRQNRVSVSVDWSGDLWHQAREPKSGKPDAGE